MPNIIKIHNKHKNHCQKNGSHTDASEDVESCESRTNYTAATLCMPM